MTSLFESGFFASAEETVPIEPANFLDFVLKGFGSQAGLNDPFLNNLPYNQFLRISKKSATKMFGAVHTFNETITV